MDIKNCIDECKYHVINNESHKVKKRNWNKTARHWYFNTKMPVTVFVSANQSSQPTKALVKTKGTLATQSPLISQVCVIFYNT